MLNTYDFAHQNACFSIIVFFLEIRGDAFFEIDSFAYIDKGIGGVIELVDARVIRQGLQLDIYGHRG